MERANFIIDLDDKFYPENPVHDYSIFLGKFTDSTGKNLDLAIFDVGGWMTTGGDYRPSWCDATAHSNTAGDYSSGELNDQTPESIFEWKREVYRRAKIMNIIK